MIFCSCHRIRVLCVDGDLEFRLLFRVSVWTYEVVYRCQLRAGGARLSTAVSPTRMVKTPLRVLQIVGKRLGTARLDIPALRLLQNTDDAIFAESVSIHLFLPSILQQKVLSFLELSSLFQTVYRHGRGTRRTETAGDGWQVISRSIPTSGYTTFW
jgi:hypothetical protein